jgi:hypothetical protein
VPDPEIIIVGLLLAGAIGAGIQSLRLPPGAQRAKWAFIGSALLGGLFCFVGTWNLIGIHTARHLSVSGTISGLEQHGGRGSSSDFKVVPVTGQPLKVHCEYAGPRLQDGENVAVEVLSFHNTLLHLEVLDGGNVGWKVSEGDGTASSVAVLVLGAALIAGARVHRLRNPEG